MQLFTETHRALVHLGVQDGVQTGMSRLVFSYPGLHSQTSGLMQVPFAQPFGQEGKHWFKLFSYFWNPSIQVQIFGAVQVALTQPFGHSGRQALPILFSWYLKCIKLVSVQVEGLGAVELLRGHTTNSDSGS